MRISLNWLRDYLDIKPDVDASQISASLTLAGLEVEAIEYLNHKAQELLLGVVKQVREQQDGKYSYVIAGDADNDFSISGTKSSIMPGMVVAYKPGSSKKKSEHVGVLANYGDLGLEAGVNEPLAFPRESIPAELPKNLSSLKEFDDVIFSLGITPNRADALSHLGVSRELSALLDFSPRAMMLTPKEMAGPTHEKIAIEIQNAEDCPRYACRVVENITIQDSPFWLKLKLICSGIRPINNVVDVTNFVMLSRGQPMHAFDYSKLHKENTRAKIFVRRACAGETLKTLDGKEVTLSPEDVLVADGQIPLALAGVIGGIDSAISAETTSVVLESAYFEPKNVRMTARRHGIITDSSYRFERGADPNGVVDSLNYAARILTEIADGKVSREVIDAYRKRIDPVELKMRPERAQSILGMSAEDFDQDLLRKRFLRLGIETVAKRGDAIFFRVPTHRSDLVREIDLIEEAARMIGYDKVKEVSVGIGVEPSQFADERSELAMKKMREALAYRSFSEVINYSFLNKDFQNLFLDEEDQENSIEVKNPLSDRYGVMRRSLIPGLVKNLLHNQRNQEKSVLLFEIGTVFLGKREAGDKPNPSMLSGQLDQDSFGFEKSRISGVVAGKDVFWAFDHPNKNLDFYHVKGVLTEILRLFGLDDEFPKQNLIFEHGSEIPFLHPGESVTVVRRPQDGGKLATLGFLGKLHPELSAKLEILGDAYVFELDLSEIALCDPGLPRFKPFSRYPTIERDVAFLVDESVKVSDLLKAAEDTSEGETLASLRVFDIYRGKNIDAGKKSVAVSLSLQRSDRTLTDEEASEFMKAFTKRAEDRVGAKVR